MSDTQWSRFMVFQQAGEGEPLMHNGTVHAPDIEMALLNARDVFVRRPDATEIWVVSAEAIYSRTREELAKTIARSAKHDEAIPKPKLEDYYVFGKLSEQGQASQLGEVEASSTDAALEAAMEKYKDRQVLRWYIFPVSAVLKSKPGEAAPMFAPARDKTYKDQAEYPVVTMMRQIRATGHLEEDK